MVIQDGKIMFVKYLRPTAFFDNGHPGWKNIDKSPLKGSSHHHRVLNYVDSYSQVRLKII